MYFNGKKQKLKNYPTNKLKILNDPIYGFIRIPNSLIFDIIEHPSFQRLRRVSLQQFNKNKNFKFTNVNIPLYLKKPRFYLLNVLAFSRL